MAESVASSIGPLAGDFFIKNVITNQPHLIIQLVESHRLLRETAERLRDFSGEFVLLVQEIVRMREPDVISYCREVYRSLQVIDKLLQDMVRFIQAFENRDERRLLEFYLNGKLEKDLLEEVVGLAIMIRDPYRLNRVPGKELKLINGLSIRCRCRKLISASFERSQVLFVFQKKKQKISIYNSDILVEFHENQRKILKENLMRNEIKVCVTDDALPGYFKDTLESMNVQLFEAAHPDDIKLVKQYCINTEIGFCLNCEIEAKVDTQGTFLHVLFDGPTTLIEPSGFEHKGDIIVRASKFLMDFRNSGFLCVPGGGMTELILSSKIEEFPFIASGLQLYAKSLIQNSYPYDNKKWLEILVYSKNSPIGIRVVNFETSIVNEPLVLDSYIAK